MATVQQYRTMHARVDFTGRIARSITQEVTKRCLGDMTREHGGELDAFWRTTRLGAHAGAAAWAWIGMGQLTLRKGLPPALRPNMMVFGSGLPYRSFEHTTPGWMRPFNTLAEQGICGFLENSILALADRAERAHHNAVSKGILSVAIGVRLGLQLPRAVSATLVGAEVAVGALLGAAVAAGYWMYQYASGRTFWLDDCIQARVPLALPVIANLHRTLVHAAALTRLREQAASWPSALAIGQLVRANRADGTQMRELSRMLTGCQTYWESFEATARRMHRQADDLRAGDRGFVAGQIDAMPADYRYLVNQAYPNCETAQDITRAWRRASLFLHPDKVDALPLDESRKQVLAAVFSILTQLKELACGV